MADLITDIEAPINDTLGVLSGAVAGLVNSMLALLPSNHAAATQIQQGAQQIASAVTPKPTPAA